MPWHVVPRSQGAVGGHDRATSGSNDFVRTDVVGARQQVRRGDAVEGLSRGRGHRVDVAASHGDRAQGCSRAADDATEVGDELDTGAVRDVLAGRVLDGDRDRGLLTTVQARRGRGNRDGSRRANDRDRGGGEDA